VGVEAIQISRPSLPTFHSLTHHRVSVPTHTPLFAVTFLTLSVDTDCSIPSSPSIESSTLGCFSSCYCESTSFDSSSTTYHGNFPTFTSEHIKFPVRQLDRRQNAFLDSYLLGDFRRMCFSIFRYWPHICSQPLLWRWTSGDGTYGSYY
jgi:hypothetical protein